MTWDTMYHEGSKLRGFVRKSPSDPKIVGFILKGKTYDGDGNLQWPKGTDMVVTFKNKTELRSFVNKLEKVM
ncbi:MAG: hypothetical protein PVI03_01460 [Candidatus Thorarchaeota archaeon]|jgi:hypothetical protein